MSYRYALPIACFVLAISVPIAPRLAAALTWEDGAVRLGTWTEQLRLQAANRPARLAADWLWVIGPHFALGLAALLWTRPGLCANTRRRRTWGCIAGAAVAAVIGFYLCQPVRGMGFNFYIGEGIYPIAAVVAMAVSYAGGWFAARATE